MKFFFLIAILFTPSVRAGLSNAELTKSDLSYYHQNLVVFEAYCGYRSKSTSKCVVAVTPSRLYVDDDFIPLDSIQKVFVGTNHSGLTGDRFREAATGLKRKRSEVVGLYYKKRDGMLGAAAFAFGHESCKNAFNVTLDFVRYGGIIPAPDVRLEGPCGLTDDTSFDLKANYK